MENIEAKKEWLKNEYANKLADLDPDAERQWGKMNVQQMIEHMADYVRIANGGTPMEIVTPEEHLPKMQAFLASEKPFRENTPNALMPETPPATRHTDISGAINELQEELNYFFDRFSANPGLEINNPFFGSLNFDMQAQLLHKHAWHHLRQFGITDAD